MKGKYGYIDPTGQLREASYGAGTGQGFQPEIAGVELPALPAPAAPVAAPAPAAPSAPAAPAGRFRNFQPQPRVKLVNGRRAVLRRRVKATPAPPAFIDPSARAGARERNLRARQQQLRALDSSTRALLALQANNLNSRTESFRSLSPPAPSSDPFTSGVDLSTGSSSLSY